MAIKIKIPKSENGVNKDRKARGGLPRDPVLRAALIIFLVAAVGFSASFCYFYIKYDRIITQRFRSPVFSNSAKIYAIPRTIHDGNKANAKEIASRLGARISGRDKRTGSLVISSKVATCRSEPFSRIVKSSFFKPAM